MTDSVLDIQAVAALVTFIEQRGYFTHAEARALAIMKSAGLGAEDAAVRLRYFIDTGVNPVAAASNLAVAIQGGRWAEATGRKRPDGAWFGDPLHWHQRSAGASDQWARYSAGSAFFNIRP